MNKHKNGTKRSTNIIVCLDAKSPYWIAQFTAPNRRRVRRSTKVPVSGGFYEGEKITKTQAKSRAMLVALELAQLAEEEASSESNMTVRELFGTMLQGKLGRVSPATYKNARTDYAQFCSWLGTRADNPARLIKRVDALAWLTARRAQVRANTCHKALTALRAAFSWAVDAELLSTNPFINLKVQPDTKDEKIVHEAFTLDEVRLLLDKLPDEWSSAVRCCIGTYGQRLGDILNLRWEQFDWRTRTVNLITGKTARELHQPMQDTFFQWARARYEQAQQQGGEAAIWVHPALRCHTNPSNEFTTLVRLHGIGLTGTGLAGSRRTWHSKTFHSLRATVATLLQASGVAQGLAMELVGHESAAVHAAYIRPTAALLRAAASRLPQL